jgi:hypothetical protein
LGADTVLKLSSTLPENENYKVYADNFFSGIEVAEELLQKGIHYTGTIRKNRLPGCDLKTEKVLEKEGRGSMDSMVEVNKNIIAVRWMDTKCVTLISTHLGKEPIEKVNRWDKKSKAYKLVKRPSIVKHYNEFMGGVDFQDRMCAKCRYKIRSKRWYMHIFWFTTKIAMSNAWIMYRRDHLKKGDKKKDILKLKHFQAHVATVLTKGEQADRKRGRPRESEEPVCQPPHPPRKHARIEPPSEIRYDGVQHRVGFQTRGKCAKCKTGFCETCCTKCDVRLCIKKKSNCFDDYHYKK